MSNQLLEGLERRLLFAAAPVALYKQQLIQQAVSNITTTNSQRPTRIAIASPSSSVIQPATTQSSSLINLNTFRADARFAAINGSGFSTVILDTGIDLNHPFFGPDADSNGVSDRIVYQYDFAHNDANASDYNGHGSNVSSIVASSDATYMGMAPGASVIHLKVFTDAGAGNFGYTEKALQWVVANAAAYNIASVNMSLGDMANHSTSQQLYGVSDELAALAAMDVIVVSASGNDYARFGSAQGVAYPAADPNSLAVGAVYDSNVGGYSYASGAQAYSTFADAITPFTQRHSTLLDILAPGAPITGANYNGGTVTQHGTSQASPHVAGIAVLAQQLAMQTIGRRLTLTEFKQLLQDSADVIVDGDNENDNVANSGQSWGRVNVFALGEAVLQLTPPNAPEIQVFDGSTGLRHGVSTTHFGTTMTGVALTRTFTVKNFGLQALDLTSSVTLPAGFSLVSGFGATTLAAGATTTFTVRLDATAVGTYSGTLGFTNTDSNESPFNFTITGTVQPWSAKVENTDAGFALTGTWTNSAEGSGGSLRYSNLSGNTATWTFTGVPGGYYRVLTTWTPYMNRTAAAPYVVTDGSVTLASTTLNQQLSPNDLTAGGVAWEQIAASVLVVGGTLVARLTVGSGYTFADAIRIEQIAPLPSNAEITVTEGGNNVATGGSVAFGTTGAGMPLTRTFTVRNLGQATLNLGSISVPSGFTLLTAPASTSLITGQSTTFTVRLDATTLGTYAGSVSFTTNDPDESPFVVSVSGAVSTVLVKDDGDAGFATSGAWTNSTGGYTTDIRYSNVAGHTATWTFAGVTPGMYRVSTTWSAYSNRTVAASYAVLNNASALSTVTFNQRNAPNDRVENGTWFEDLGAAFNITSNTLVVRATVPAGGYYLMADAVRIERVGEAVFAPEVAVAMGATAIASGGSVSFGAATVGTPVSRTFTIRNDGALDLTLASLTAPSGFTITSGFGATTLAPGDSTTCVVQMNAAATGSFAGNLTFTSNDSDEATYSIALSGSASETWIVDDGDPGFGTTGTWTNSTGGYTTDIRYSNVAGHTATWTLTSLAPGTYRVSTTWTAYINRVAGASYEVLDGVSTVASRVMNQQVAPNDFTSVVSWEDISGSVMITGNTLTVRATVPAGALYLMADAVRVEKLAALPAGAEIAVAQNGASLATGASVAFGSTSVGTAINRTFTVRNLGQAALSLGAISVPSGFTVTAGFGSTTLLTGQSTAFTVRMDASSAGSVGGNISFTSNDSDESPYTLAVSGSASIPPVIIDDGDAGVTTTTGTWTTTTGGRNGDIRYNNVPGSTYTWTFNGLIAGNYRVLTTWDPYINRSGAVTFAVYDGATWRAGRAIDQRAAPNDMSYAGSAWETVATSASISGTTLVVRATVPASGYTMADAVYVERLPVVSQANLRTTVKSTRSLFSGTRISNRVLLQASTSVIATPFQVLPA